MPELNFSPESLDNALASGVIRPDQHAALMSRMPSAAPDAPVGPMASGYGVPPEPTQSVAPPPAPPPPAVSPPSPATAAPFGEALAGAGMALPPTQAPPVTSGGSPPPPPPPGSVPPMLARPPEASPGQVDVGPITQTSPAPPPVAGLAPRIEDPRMRALRKDEALDVRAQEREAKLGEAQVQAAEARAAAAQGALAGAKDLQAKQAAQAAADEVRDQKHREEVQAAVTRVGQMKVDPDAFWKNQSGAQKVGNILAIALSGIGMGIAGHAGANPAMDAIQRRIDENIDAQKANIANAREGVNAKRGVLADSIALTGSHTAGAAAANAMYWQNVAQQAQVELAKMDPKTIGAATQSTVDAIQRRANDARATLETTLANEQRARAAAAAAARAAADKLKFEQGAKLEELGIQKTNAASTRIQAEAQRGGPPELRYKKETEDASYQAADKSLAHAEKMVVDNLPYNGVTRTLGSVFNTDSHSRYQAGLQQYAKALKAASGDSSDKDREALLALAPQPNDDADTIRDKMQQAREILATSHPAAAARAARSAVPTTDAPSDR